MFAELGHRRRALRDLDSDGSPGAWGPVGTWEKEKEKRRKAEEKVLWYSYRYIAIGIAGSSFWGWCNLMSVFYIWGARDAG